MIWKGISGWMPVPTAMAPSRAALLADSHVLDPGLAYLSIAGTSVVGLRPSPRCGAVVLNMYSSIGGHSTYMHYVALLHYRVVALLHLINLY